MLRQIKKLPSKYKQNFTYDEFLNVHTFSKTSVIYRFLVTISSHRLINIDLYNTQIRIPNYFKDTSWSKSLYIRHYTSGLRPKIFYWKLCQYGEH